MTTQMLTFKLQTLYGAYAPSFDVSAYGACRDEALNNLTDELRQHQPTKQGAGYERKMDAIR